MAKNTDAIWVEVDVASLSDGARKAYEAYKDMYRQMKAKREEFEGLIAKDAGVPEGKRMVFGYNFGKLSVAIVDDDRKPAKAKPAKLSLADYMAQMQRAGLRS